MVASMSEVEANVNMLVHLKDLTLLRIAPSNSDENFTSHGFCGGHSNMKFASFSST